jgi:hypothetical protein
MTTHWVEMSLMHSGDESAVDVLVALVDERHDGETVFTATGPNLTLALVDESSEQIEQVICRLVSLVRNAAIDAGFATLGWPEPVRIGDVRATPMETAIPA